MLGAKVRKSNTLKMNVPCPIDLNNVAVGKLQEEKPDEAIHLLRNALADIKNQFAERAIISPSCKTSQQVSSVSGFDDRCERGRQFLSSQPGTSFYFQGYDEQEQHEESPSFDSNDEDCEHMVDIDGSICTPFLQSIVILSDAALHRSKDFDQAIVALYDRAFFIANDENADKESLSSVLLYNMALVNHLSGIEKGDQTYLTTAFKLYQMSLEIAIQNDIFPSDADVLIMALYNNMAHIHSHQFSIAEARSAMDEMNLVLEDEHTSSLINEDDYALFCLNVMVFEELKLNSAPAA
jgi:hypothetical protein